MEKRFRFIFVVALLSSLRIFVTASGFSQPLDPKEITKLVQDCKKDERGPYQAIRWFCPDGTILPPDKRCPEPGGIQHALHKDAVQKIAKQNGISLGQILAGTPFTDFLDAANQNSRLKQYQMEKYLQSVDDGWIFRRARFYRGAIQAEDEEDWGRKFLSSLLTNDELLASQFFLVRQANADIPHQANDNRLQSIRALSKTIADSLPLFLDIRVKIHGQPDAGDLQRVKDFRARQRQKIPAKIDELLQALEKDLALAYQSSGMQSFNQYTAKLPAKSPVAEQLKSLITAYGSPASNSSNRQNLLRDKNKALAELLWNIRLQLRAKPPAKARMAMMDLSNEVESMLFREIQNWQPATIGELLEKNYTLALAAAGCGFLEVWEWEAISPLLLPVQAGGNLSLEQLLERAACTRRAVEWGAGMVRANYDPVVALFGSFEPLANGFIDDRIRSSVLLALGEAVGQLTDEAARRSGLTNNVMRTKNQNQIRGLNPGFAVGELEVITSPPDDISFSAQKIYALLRAPADLKPVAGIATVSEGNMVSHVQLLARNLGIPNAVLSQPSLEELAPFSGQRVFYAVSPRGAVVMKPATEMASAEKALVEERKRREERIMAPTNKIDLKQTNLASLKSLRASDSGRLCGPKAANLGQLKNLFPDNVVEGFVIPFAVFRQHLDQPMDTDNVTYWQFLQETFKQAGRERENGKPEEEIENYTLQRLSQLREAIKTMPFLPAFQEKLQRRFVEIFGQKMGEVPVFIRSDTNMEDLKDFTGAGLNLTVFNVLEQDKILQGIRDVWASPYTERSYRWRQKYLLNPENVYPSILILPTVDVDKSGVMITTGVASAEARDVTIAFNRGAGGAVEGQAAESYLLRHDGNNLLLSPAREAKHTVLPPTGGTGKGFANFNQPILSAVDLKNLRDLADKIKKKLPGTPGIETAGPFDVELGFKDGTIWLFQVRPYVENKRAKSSMYLQALDPQLPQNVRIALSDNLVAQQK